MWGETCPCQGEHEERGRERGRLGHRRVVIGTVRTRSDCPASIKPTELEIQQLVLQPLEQRDSLAVILAMFRCTRTQ